MTFRFRESTTCAGPRHVWRWAILLVALAFAIRLGVALAAFHKPLTFDALDYERIARSIADGHGYPSALGPVGGPTAFRPPAFPYLLSLVYALHDSRDAGRIAEALLGTCAVALIGVLGYQLFGTRVALGALAIAAIYPPLIIIGTSLLSEPLFITLELAALVAALRFRASSDRYRWAALAGALAGMAWLTRASGPVIVLAVVLLVWIGGRRFSRQAAIAPAIAVLAAIVAIAPWTIRNAVVMHAFVPVSDETGYTLAGTYNHTSADSTTYPGAWIPAQNDPANAALIGRAHEIQEDRILQRAASRFALRHPIYVLKVGVYNALRFLALDHVFDVDSHTSSPINYRGEEYVSDAIAKLAIASFSIVLLLALVGVLAGALRRAPAPVWAVPALLFLGTIFVIFGNRYRLVVDPFLIILAASAIVSCRLPLRRSSARPSWIVVKSL